jgi:cyclic pyranopterin phosphate synthase
VQGRAGESRRRSPEETRRRPHNISLDTLDRTRFAATTRRDKLLAVLTGIAAAEDAGLAPIKLNAVIRRGVNEQDILPLHVARPRTLDAAQFHRQ